MLCISHWQGQSREIFILLLNHSLCYIPVISYLMYVLGYSLSWWKFHGEKFTFIHVHNCVVTVDKYTGMPQSPVKNLHLFLYIVCVSTEVCPSHRWLLFVGSDLITVVLALVQASSCDTWTRQGCFFKALCQEICGMIYIQKWTLKPKLILYFDIPLSKLFKLAESKVGLDQI